MFFMVITNDIPVPPLVTPINTSTSQNTSNSWNLNPNSHQKTSKSAQPPTTYGEHYEAKKFCRSDYEYGRISWEREEETTKDFEYQKLSDAKEVEYWKLQHAKEEKEKYQEFQ
ncbi:hypothetical protein PPACK8108_LOCUS24599 [Phakopsora pachyrhizi]|uniref:Uncharacterized protein n=1 Tax=Phakopsora pachyrhizi TaxID=170000 RepID=A0AAV0BTF1_PHAPC|nr:hypothetical protein PPACK8108_LOCUS24599 [Phakopsora pachyrhizi]